MRVFVCVCVRVRVCACVQTMPLIPLSRLAPRLRRSVEGLNLELEGVFVSETAKEQHKVSVCICLNMYVSDLQFTNHLKPV